MKARLGGEYGNAGSHIVMMERKEKRLDYYPIGDNTIQVGQRDGPVLNGPIIQDLKGWRVTDEEQGAKRHGVSFLAMLSKQRLRLTEREDGAVGGHSSTEGARGLDQDR
jgi:hypothetical protein